MESELKALEDKIDQFVRLCQQLRSENIHLRQQLAAATSENKRLVEKINAAADRLEALLAQFPKGHHEGHEGDEGHEQGNK
jgi:cell division protein ZapB